MSDNKIQSIKNNLPKILSLIFASIILFYFFYSLIKLIVQPSSSFVIEKRRNISRRNYIWLYCKRRESITWTKL